MKTDCKNQVCESAKERDEKKGRKKSGGAGGARRKDNSTAVNEPPSETPDATAKEKKQTEPDPTSTPPDVEDQLEYTNNPPAITTDATNDTAAFPAPKGPAATLRPRTGADKKHWPFSIHTGESANVLKPHGKCQFETL